MTPRTILSHQPTDKSEVSPMTEDDIRHLRADYEAAVARERLLREALAALSEQAARALSETAS